MFLLLIPFTIRNENRINKVKFVSTIRYELSTTVIPFRNFFPNLGITIDNLSKSKGIHQGIVGERNPFPSRSSKLYHSIIDRPAIHLHLHEDGTIAREREDVLIDVKSTNEKLFLYELSEVAVRDTIAINKSDSINEESENLNQSVHL